MEKDVKIARIWRPEKKAYDKYYIPMSWYTPLWTANMDAVVNCASCGKQLKYGDTFSSRFIHTEMGIAYYVCPECHEKEIAAEKSALQIVDQWEDVDGRDRKTQIMCEIGECLEEVRECVTKLEGYIENLAAEE